MSVDYELEFIERHIETCTLCNPNDPRYWECPEYIKERAKAEVMADMEHERNQEGYLSA
jgi:hypothetical protein